MKLDLHSLNVDRVAWDRWSRLAEDAPDAEAIIHWRADGESLRRTRGSLLMAANHYARCLRDLGVKKNDVCALVIRHNVEFYPCYMAISALGALPAVLAYPNPRIHPDKFRQGLEGMALRSGLDWLLTERDLETLILPLVSRPGSTIRGIFFPLEWRQHGETERESPGPSKRRPEDPCLLQHSSGTTGLQKAVVLSNRAVLEHVLRYGEAIGVGPGDRIVSWLPLYHDMGLIAAFYLPLTAGIPVIQIDPFEWVSAPSIFLEAISKEKGTLAWLPNFAYNFLAERVKNEDIEGFRLDSLRMLINCSEPVRAGSHDRFIDRFEPFGARRETLAACYAMAETTFAVTQTPPGEEAGRLNVHREAIGQGFVRESVEGENGRICVSSGVPISGCELRIVGERGESLADGEVGEIAVRSVSLFEGYRNNPEKTSEVLKEGWYLSGDYGFSHRGELYIIGRKKDLIIVAGKNIYPEDIEDAVGQVAGVIPGRAIAFGIEDDMTGTEQVCVVAETPLENDSEKRKLRMAVKSAGMQIDVTIARVYLAPPRWLVKSSSGKPSRGTNRERALAGLSWR